MHDDPTSIGGIGAAIDKAVRDQLIDDARRGGRRHHRGLREIAHGAAPTRLEDAEDAPLLGRHTRRRQRLRDAGFDAARRAEQA
ncbi:Uncharacterised protein [Mycobacteroides abscessus subsp. abscessus]|nr:Uncharacterised protein [Mycobacteroides abscessus subsp. abscessus]